MLSHKKFVDSLRTEFLPDFCSHYRYENFSFDERSLDKLPDDDAARFLLALEIGAVIRQGAFFYAPRSGAKEMIFWAGSKTAESRPISLWLEPVITIGTAGLLATEYRWPISSIGLQSPGNWAFDLICFDRIGLVEIVCEVKKSQHEIDLMISNMQMFFEMKTLSIEPKSSSARNSYRKISGLRKLRPKLFWAVGPNGYQKLFRVAFSDLSDSIGHLIDVDRNHLIHDRIADSLDTQVHGRADNPDCRSHGNT